MVIESIKNWIGGIWGMSLDPADEYDENYDADLNLSLPDGNISVEDAEITEDQE